MAKDNIKIGYCYSVALHVLVAVAMFAYAMVDLLFPKEMKENALVFDMVEPNTTLQEIPTPPPTKQQEEIKVEKIERVEPIEIPDPEPEPEPEPEVKQPEPEPTDTPAPKKIEQKPKKISFAEFRKKNPKKTSKRKQTKQRQIKIGQIKSNHSNLDTISDITPRVSANSAAMQDALAAYVAEIKIKVKRSWKIPPNCTGLSTEVAFKISKTGIISGIRIVRSSGDKTLDATIVEALQSITISPPPNNASQSVSITFNAT